MAGADAIAFAAAELLNLDFVAPEFANNAGGDFRAADGRLANLRAAFHVAEEQDAIEAVRLGSFGQVLDLDFEGLTFFDSILVITVSDDRVHVVAPCVVSQTVVGICRPDAPHVPSAKGRVLSLAAAGCQRGQRNAVVNPSDDFRALMRPRF